MKLQTRIFGEIEIDESKKLIFEQGIIGYPDLKEFFLKRQLAGYSQRMRSVLLCQ